MSALAHATSALANGAAGATGPVYLNPVQEWLRSQEGQLPSAADAFPSGSSKKWDDLYEKENNVPFGDEGDDAAFDVPTGLVGESEEYFDADEREDLPTGLVGESEEYFDANDDIPADVIGNLGENDDDDESDVPADVVGTATAIEGGSSYRRLLGSNYPKGPCSPNGAFAAYGTGFLKCDNKKWVQFACGKGTVFDPKTKVCSRPKSNSSRCSPNGSFLPAADGFLTCANGGWVYRDCDPGTKFSSALKTCVRL